MRILFFASYAPSLINFRGKLIELLIKSGHQVYAVAPRSTYTKALKSELSSIGVIPLSISLEGSSLNAFKDMLAIVSLAKLILAINPDVLLPYTIKPIIYSGIVVNLSRYFGFLRECRMIAMITGLGYAFSSCNRMGFRYRAKISFFSLLYKSCLAPARQIIFQNPDDQSEFYDRNILSTSHEVYRVRGSGVSLPDFPRAPLPRKNVFLMLARMLRDKGIYEYVQAARVVKKIYPETIFRIAGSIPQSNPDTIKTDQIRAWSEEGVIEYLGDVKDVSKQLQLCRCYVLPSYREGLPRSVLEALSTARPIITTDVPGCRETVQDGVNGFLVKPRCSDSLADAMLKMTKLSDSQISLMASASYHIAQSYDVNNVNRELMQIISP